MQHTKWNFYKKDSVQNQRLLEKDFIEKYNNIFMSNINANHVDMELDDKYSFSNLENDSIEPALFESHWQRMKKAYELKRKRVPSTSGSEYLKNSIEKCSRKILYFTPEALESSLLINIIKKKAPEFSKIAEPLDVKINCFVSDSNSITNGKNSTNLLKITIAGESNINIVKASNLIKKLLELKQKTIKIRNPNKRNLDLLKRKFNSRQCYICGSKDHDFASCFKGSKKLNIASVNQKTGLEMKDKKSMFLLKNSNMKSNYLSFLENIYNINYREYISASNTKVRNSRKYNALIAFNLNQNIDKTCIFNTFIPFGSLKLVKKLTRDILHVKSRYFLVCFFSKSAMINSFLSINGRFFRGKLISLFVMQN
ncbi:hypothetical protein BNATCHR361 (nucleomorph) [Bigelowiella natans]|uniref:Uncharacterized protein n=1 Tax=Bigelowiella natans TaxID=227086 RepID=Q3LW08_BIGNA|nr:hypothetical protein BNATCHR361 [Bigelowiella natans]ABA27358.1 hypothetical protein [Bigelowiella natans]